MNSDEVARRARLVIARELACPLGRVRDDAEFIDDLKADSLDMVRLPAALEEEFDVRLTDDEVAFCKTVGTAIDVLSAKLENGHLA
jgi:acyl carrier protein